MPSAGEIRQQIASEIERRRRLAVPAFAAGFLYGITNGLSPEDAARLGGVCAAEVISHVGARPLGDLRALAVEAGLFS